LESRKYSFEFGTRSEHESLEKLIAKAEQRYIDVGSALAQLFVRSFQKAHPLKGLLRQRDVFETQLKPKLGERKVAYVWVASIAMFGNTNQPVEVMVRSSHLFISMPDVIREDMAFLDRIHVYVPGWEVPKMRVEFFTDHYGFVVDYLAEALKELLARLASKCPRRQSGAEIGFRSREAALSPRRVVEGGIGRTGGVTQGPRRRHHPASIARQLVFSNVCPPSPFRA
jgi:hypothetical protein